MEDRPFNIVDYIPPVTLDYSSDTAWATSDPSAYSPLTLFGPDGFIYQSQIDMAGWTKEGLTAFFSNQYLQRDGPYTPSGPMVPTDTLQARDYVIITDVPLQTNNVTIHAGFPDEASDYMTIKFGQVSIFCQSTTTPTMMVNADGWGIGSGEPTASGTLYVTRIVIAHKDSPSAADAISFPALRYVAQGIATAEPEYVYLNRLRRSYELHQFQS
jgi:hypothetical protein